MQTTAWLIKLPVATGWWRGLGLLANTFAVESFINELAAAANLDPLEFRLRHLPDSEKGQRRSRCFAGGCKHANWGAAQPDGHTLGLAMGYDVGTISVEIAEASLQDSRDSRPQGDRCR